MVLLNQEKLPEFIIPLLKVHVGILVNTLQDKLTGVYVHGSAAMGGFHPEQSDVDYLAVISNPLDAIERKTLADAFLTIYGKGAPANGVEMSIVLIRFAGTDFQHPTPFEFHMGTPAQIQSQAVLPDTGQVDADLAAHFTIVRNRGICVYGKAIKDVFSEVPRKYYIDSIVRDFHWSYKNIIEKTGDTPCHVPIYAVLNFCRILGFLESNSILSKAEGGLWGLKNLPDTYHPLISEAIKEYRSPLSSEKADPELLKEFAFYAQKRINAFKP